MKFSLSAILLRLVLSLFGLTFALVAAEFLLVIFVGKPEGRLRVCSPCSYIYDLIPSKDDTNAAGFRGPELQSESTFRIAILGDSVTYGAEVTEAETFARRLQNLVGHEVVNAGVVGYTTFNEVQVLREKILPLKPDVIVLQTCMNDVVDPELHWNRWSRTRRAAPPEAFPNPAMLEGSGAKAAAQREIWLARSHIITEVRLLLLRLGLFTSNREMNIEKNGSLWPTYTTYESNADLLPLTNYDSPEWQWLRVQLDQLRQLAGQTPVVLMVVPLAYELMPGYPLDPEAQFMRYCQETGITCLNMRDKFKGHHPEELYVMRKPGSYPNLPDVWHFNRAGHELAARELANLLKEKGFLPH